MKISTGSLEKLETITSESGYTVRYEKGSFQSGYCILEDRKVIVLNKFLSLEGRINTMLDLLGELDIHPENLSELSRKLYEQILKDADKLVPVSMEQEEVAA